MDEYFAEHPEQGLMFYEDMKDRYPSFLAYCEKKRAQLRKNGMEKAQSIPEVNPDEPNMP